MAVPSVHLWRQREVVTAATMNGVRDVHRFLYTPPACKVIARQRGTYSGANPTDAFERGRWVPFNTWCSFPWHLPGKGSRPSEEYDTTGGSMTAPNDSGILWRLIAPEDGLYAVTFGGVMDANGEANNAHFRLGRNQTVDSQWSTGYAPFASHSPGRARYAQDGTAQFIGSISTTVALKRGETVSAAGVSDKDFILGRYSLPGRSFLEMRWVGRLV
ncbi:hypothetical protein [Streptomyces buecherae]|uniref:Uncharacterized protein n=1 Tax=Streptomyces buecherae TaxID=2763006 RepID=A0A7H8N3A9_9ACTN|nr:hypothetical protein [Streptomyces buecherae]QKW48876.1 hypothetical protein HUT08_04210 [Streptomyces buecherae]